MLLWERFRVVSPKLVEFKAVKLGEVIVDGIEKEKTSHYWPQG